MVETARQAVIVVLLFSSLNITGSGHPLSLTESKFIMLSVSAWMGEDLLIDFNVSLAFFSVFCHVCSFRPGRLGLRAPRTLQRVCAWPETEDWEEDIVWAEWLSKRGDPQIANEKRMGANGSSYPHSCSPRIGGNAQAQQTFIGMCFICALIMHAEISSPHVQSHIF